MEKIAARGVLHLASHRQDTPHDELIQSFLDSLSGGGRSENTVKSYGYDLQSFSRWLQKDGGHLLRVDLAALERYLNKLQAEGSAATTRKRLMTSLRGFYGWCQRRDLLENDPTRLVNRVKTPENSPHPLNLEVAEKVLAAIPQEAPEYRLLFTLLLETGIRVGEALTMRRERIDLTPGRESFWVLGKGWRERLVLVHTARRSVELLGERLSLLGNGPGYLFPNPRKPKEPMQYRAALINWYRYCDAAGIPKHQRDALHSLRHACITDWINRGVPEETVSRLAGHKDSRTTRQYTAYSFEKLHKDLSKGFSP